MSPEDKAFYEAQISMFETTGWRDLQDTINQLIDVTTKDIVNGNKESFDVMKGQLNTLVWLSGYEAGIRTNYEQNTEELEDAAV